ncbi:flagellar assembly protein A [uncultured Clostridium sp.]|uniref:flagellar assembly protein A n=1 Tax=uncultured Clostridium sp. TaxID=59620 RepID=UPI0025EC9B6B|nr:flagellar assembly protein A [uncultured Clostridium sp.]
MEILFKDSDRLEENAETEFKIDYRNRFMLATVKTGEEIARIIPAVIGKDRRIV